MTLNQTRWAQCVDFSAAMESQIARASVDKPQKPDRLLLRTSNQVLQKKTLLSVTPLLCRQNKIAHNGKCMTTSWCDDYPSTKKRQRPRTIRRQRLLQGLASVRSRWHNELASSASIRPNHGERESSVDEMEHEWTKQLIKLQDSVKLNHLFHPRICFITCCLATWFDQLLWWCGWCLHCLHYFDWLLRWAQLQPSKHGHLTSQLDTATPKWLTKIEPSCTEGNSSAQHLLQITARSWFLAGITALPSLTTWAMYISGLFLNALRWTLVLFATTSAIPNVQTIHDNVAIYIWPRTLVGRGILWCQKPSTEMESACDALVTCMASSFVYFVSSCLIPFCTHRTCQKYAVPATRLAVSSSEKALRIFMQPSLMLSTLKATWFIFWKKNMVTSARICECLCYRRH